MKGSLGHIKISRLISEKNHKRLFQVEKLCTIVYRDKNFVNNFFKPLRAFAS